MGNIFKYSNVGGFKTTTHYPDMLAGNTVWNPYSPTGAYDALATVTVPSGGASSITFSGIPSTYTHLQIRYSTRTTGSGTNYGSNWVLNGDTGANYSWHYIYADGSTTTAGGGANTTAASIGQDAGGGITANVYAAGILDILDYSNINKYKTLRLLNGFDANGSGFILPYSANWRSTSAINSISVSNGSTYAANSTFSLYGVR